MIKRPSHTTTNDLLDEEALIEEARQRARRRRHLRFRIAIVLFAAACLIAAGIVHYASSPTRTRSGRPDASAKTLTCPSARVKLLGVTALAGAAVYGGLIVRASVTSSPACTMSGYPIVGAVLTSHSTTMASDVRETYLGGGMTTTAPLPRLSMTSRPRVVSFTIQWVGGNGPTCPRVNSIHITLPGSREILTPRTMYEANVGVIGLSGIIYCGHLNATPLVKGSSGKN